MKRVYKDKIKIITLLTWIFLILTTPVFAANHYVRSGASGRADGSDWTNAYTTLPNTLLRGDTYYIADGSYPGYTFDDAHSSTTYITIKKASIEVHGTDTGWSNTYGDGSATFTGTLTFTRGYYIFDGSYRNADWEDGYGFVIDRSVADNHAIELAGGWLNSGGTPTNITIKYTNMIGKYQGTNHLDLIYAIGADHINLQYNKIFNPSRCPILTRNCSYVLLEYSIIGGNTYTSAYHSEGWSDSNSNYVTIRYNKFRDAWGTGVIVVLVGPATSNSWVIYSNIFYATQRGINTSDGAITTINGINPSNWKVYNNTFYNLSGYNQGINLGRDGGTVTNCLAYNNLWYNNSTVSNAVNTIGNNWYSSTPHNTSEPNVQNATGDPFVNSGSYDLQLMAPTNAGVSLTNETINGILQTYNTDMLGNIRGSDGVWDRGAFEFQSGSQKSLEPPRNLRIIN